MQIAEPEVTFWNNQSGVFCAPTFFVWTWSAKFLPGCNDVAFRESHLLKHNWCFFQRLSGEIRLVGLFPKYEE
jgi:hypothetical protein